MTFQMITAQLLGLLGAAAMCLSFQCRDSRKLFPAQFAACSAFSIHFFMLGAFTGMCLNLAELLRAFFLIKGDKKWASHPATILSVTLLTLSCGVFA